MTKKIENLGRWAEKHFDTLCSEAGVTVNKSHEDYTGWDFLVEFPQLNGENSPLDQNKIEITARAQIKSRERGKLVASLKLSNAHRFAAAPVPCFVILVAATNGAHPVRIYARHFWRDEIAKTLKRLRQADHKKTPINRQTLTISFDVKDEHTNDLILWMSSVVSESSKDYISQKKELNENLGYEDGHFVGTITFAQDEIDKIIDHSIGLDVEINLSHARLVDKRFGIEANKPIFDFKPDRFEMRSHPKPCIVELTDCEDGIHRFEGEIFLPGIPGLPLEKLKARVVAGPLEAVFQADGNATVNYNFSYSDQHSLENLTKYISLLAKIGRGPSQFSIIHDGRRLDGSSNVDHNNDEDGLLLDSEALLKSLLSVANVAGNDDIQISLNDIIDGWSEIRKFRNYIDADSISFLMQGESDQIKSEPVERLITGLNLSMEKLTFTAVLAYQKILDEITDSGRQLTFGKPTIIRAMADDRSVESHNEEVREDFVRYARRHGNGVFSAIRTEDGLGLFAIDPNT